jgi:hypothetical protein
MTSSRPSWLLSAVFVVVVLLATCTSCFAIPERVEPTFRWSRFIPATLAGPAGPVRVELSRDVVVDGDSAWGAFYEGERVIRIDTTAATAHQLRVFYHEATHVALSDAGLEDVIPPAMQEAICNAVATARMAELRGTLR